MNNTALKNIPREFCVFLNVLNIGFQYLTQKDFLSTANSGILAIFGTLLFCVVKHLCWLGACPKSE